MTPANNITKTGDYPDAIFLQSICGCGDTDHGHRLIVETETDFPSVTCSLYQTLEWIQFHHCNSPGVFVRVWQRIKNATEYLFTGSVVAEGHHIFDEASLRDYANALLGAADELNRRMSAMQAEIRGGERGSSSSNTQDVQG